MQRKSIEVLFLNPELSFQDPSNALLSPAPGQVWRCMIRAKLSEIGSNLVFQIPSVPDDSSSENTSTAMNLEVIALHASWDEDDEDPGVEASVKLSFLSDSNPHIEPRLSLAELLAHSGEVPLPPYLGKTNDLPRYRSNACTFYRNSVFVSNR